MSNYTKTTDFEAKDSLPSGDSGKIIRGSEFETEFDNISTAIATKADAANPTFTGTVTIDGLTVNGNTVLGNAASDTVTVTADIASNLLPSADDTYNLGAVGAEWNDLFIDGVANIDSLVADTVDINGGTVDGVTIGGSSAGAITGTTITGTGFVTSGDMTFGDNDKAIFGAGSDLQIYHDGGNSRILENGTGFLAVGTNGTDIRLTGNSFTEFMAKFEQDGPVTLYHNNLAKLATTSTGIDVTGTVVSDGLTVDGAATLTGNITQTTGDLLYSGPINWDIAHTAASQNIIFKTTPSGGSATQRIRVSHNGDISFYEDTGTTAKFLWSASDEKLTIDGNGTTVTNLSTAVSQSVLELNGNSTSGSDALYFGAMNTNGDYYLQVSNGNGTAVNYDLLLNPYGGNVGIGTDSPTAFIHAEGTGGGTETYAKFSTGPAAGDQILSVKSSSVRNHMALQVNAGGGAVDDLALNPDGGNVGIGTNSPSKKLHIRGSTITGATADTNTLLYLEQNANASIQINSGATNNGQIRFGDASSNYRGALTYQHSDDSLQFVSAGSERMRIDSSGNLLVGTTSATPQDGDHGFVARATGYTISSVANARVMLLNRAGDDGDILQLRKDNAVVGNIGVDNSDNLYISGGSGHGGVEFGSNAIIPSSNGVAVDDTVRLGNSTYRYTDLFLSGGVFLGGTAAANKLDDYEEGTWTPVYTSSGGSFTTMTMDVLEASYTKIGDTVVLRGYIRTDDVDNTGATGSVTITGLPFTAAASASVDIGYAQAFNTNGHPDGAYVSSSTIFLQERATSNGGSDSLDVADLKNGTVANSNVLIFSTVYRTTA